MYDVIIKNGTVIDGTGTPMFRSDVAVKEGVIKEIGDIPYASASKIIDASGYYVAPGFVDVNNHSDTYWQIFSHPHLESLVFQGVTTIIGGNGGSSLAPLVDQSLLQSIQKWTDIQKINLNWLDMEGFLDEIEKHPLSVNFATLTGHSTLRRGIAKDESRNLVSDEMEVMLKMLKQSLKEGSLGCSVGLGFTHARHTSNEELVALGGVVRKYEGIYVLNLRDDSEHLIESMEEAMRLVRSFSGMKLHISHLKAVGKNAWPLMDKALYLIEAAQSSGFDVTFDVYPYTTTGSVLYTLLPEWVTEGGKKMMLERLKDPVIRQEVVSELREKQQYYAKAVLLMSPLNRMLVHKNISEIAKNQNKSVEEALIDLLIASDGRAIASVDVLSEENIEKAIQHPFSIISTNGSGYRLDYEATGERVHPRNFGAFPRVLSHYVRRKRLLSWEEAIHKMTGKPAKKFGLHDRGILQKGYGADIVVFHPDMIETTASMENPYRYAKGMEWVLVNGETIIEKGSFTGKRSGTVLKRDTSWF